MKAARFYEPEKPLKIEQIPKPKLEAGDVLINVKACGICGSDVHIYHGETPVGKSPIVLGHGFSGVVVEVGRNVKDIKKGDRVCIDGHIFCGKCSNCVRGRDNICKDWKFYGIHEDGGFAEYCKVREVNCIRLPNNISFEYGVLLSDAVATPYHALKLAKVTASDVVAIYGIGGIGVHAVQIAKLNEARVIAIDAVEDKLKLAKDLGADEVINAIEQDPVAKILELTNGEGADIAIEMVGKLQTIRNTFNSVRKGGKAVLVGLCAAEFPFDTRLLIRREIEIIGSYSYCKSDIEKVVELAETNKIDLSKSITHKVSLDDINRGIEILDKGIGNPLRVVVEVS